MYNKLLSLICSAIVVSEAKKASLNGPNSDNLAVFVFINGAWHNLKFNREKKALEKILLPPPPSLWFVLRCGCGNKRRYLPI
jgi:hypothetical protein